MAFLTLPTSLQSADAILSTRHSEGRNENQVERAFCDNAVYNAVSSIIFR